MLTVLDTDVISELRLPSPDARVASWFAALPAEDIALASFTLAEIAYGISALPQRRADFAAQLTRWLDAVKATLRVLPLDAEAAQVLGRMLATPELRHLALTHSPTSRPRFGGDLIIAATVIAHSALIATRNAADFLLIARFFPTLTGINPFTGQAFLKRRRASFGAVSRP